MSGNPARLHLDEPLSLDDARHAARAIAEQRRSALEAYRGSIEEAARCEVTYRKEHAIAYLRAEGPQHQREAVAKELSADAGYARDVAAGMVKAMAENLRGIEGERSLLKSLIDWSAKLDPMGGQQ